MTIWPYTEHAHAYPIHNIVSDNKTVQIDQSPHTFAYSPYDDGPTNPHSICVFPTAPLPPRISVRFKQQQQQQKSSARVFWLACFFIVSFGALLHTEENNKS